ncbi:hypothetical protein ACVBIL_15035 [Shewanella sp. 125m-7]
MIQQYDNIQVANELLRAQDDLTDHADHAKDWHISFPTDRKPYMSYGWQTLPEEGQRRGQFIEPFAPIKGDELITVAVNNPSDKSRQINFYYDTG